MATANDGDFSFAAGGKGRNGLAKIQTQKTRNKEDGMCHDDSAPPVKAKTVEELHSLQKKKSAPTTPLTAANTPFSAALSEEERHKLQLHSISASLASLTRETGPNVVKGDPSRTTPETPRVSHDSHVTHHHHHYCEPTFNTSDSALKFTHILYNLSPAELYEQALKYEKGSFLTASGALATLSGAKTGRSPRDKRVVKDEATGDLWWGK
ncbi:unnamed protein product [Cuscuta campestris]|uniref:Phosphoenolpyruvate carboxykinase (ATP) n=1 Tax=Cuscuta campestris TaxID=132261 RepID=A0A484KCL9_9ASTE|nr:unnamed protein product [Cuscuta campestris]